MERELKLIQRLADVADAMSMAKFGNHNLTIERKYDGSPVTEVDREIEVALRKEIDTAFPDDSIIGEEYGVSNADAQRVWLLDPIDGTKSYMRGNEHWATLISLQEGDNVLVAIASAPAMRQRYAASRGKGATVNGEPIHVSTVDTIGEAMLAHTSVSGFAKHGIEDRLENLARQCWDSRGSGNSFTHLSVARGTADIGWTSRANQWDYAALSLIVEEAGGKFFNGSRPGKLGPGISSNGLLHATALQAAQIED